MNSPGEQPRVQPEARQTNWNVPNALTTLRILLVPVFAWVLLHDGGEDPAWRWAAWAIFAVAMITDKVDGDLARKHNLVTDFGKIADPIADKAITGMAFIGLSIVGEIWWWVTILVLLREWSVTLLRLSVLRHVVIPAKQSGKVKTMLQALALAGLCMPLRFSGLGWFGDGVYYLAQAFLAGAVLMTLWSGFEFFRDVWRQRGALKASPRH